MAWLQRRLATLVGHDISRMDPFGPAVNLAARLEKIAGRLARTVVASEAFAGACAEGWTALGEFPVAGFSKAARVYALGEETQGG